MTTNLAHDHNADAVRRWARDRGVGVSEHEPIARTDREEHEAAQGPLRSRRGLTQRAIVDGCEWTREQRTL